MSTARPLPTRCMCGWSGSLASKTPCPACRRSAAHRITAIRGAALHALARGEQPVMWPIVRDWLLWAQLIVPLTARLAPQPDGSRHVRGKRRLFAITEAGRQAIGLGDHEERRTETQGASVVS